MMPTDGVAIPRIRIYAERDRHPVFHPWYHLCQIDGASVGPIQNHRVNLPARMATMNQTRISLTKCWHGLILLSFLALAGCGSSQAQSGGPPQMPPPEVEVSLPISREVTDYVDFPG